MQSTLKTWVGLGLATALAGTALTGCSGAGDAGESGEAEVAGETGESGEGESGEGEGGEGETGHAVGSLPLPQRLAFMAGHVEAGLALYRAGETEMAAPHLLHPVSETHADERAGLAELGFEAELFERVSAALEAGRPAAEVEDQLRAAEANLREVRARAGGDPAAIIRFLMDSVADEYTASFADGAIAEPGEYQDAFGFATVARQVAGDLGGEQGQRVRAEIDTLLSQWPDGAPIAPDDPTPAGQVSAQASRVTLTLPAE